MEAPSGPSRPACPSISHPAGRDGKRFVELRGRRGPGARDPRGADPRSVARRRDPDRAAGARRGDHPPVPTPRPRLRRLRVLALYAGALLHEFRATLLTAAVAVVLGAVLFRMTPHAALSGNRPDWLLSVYGAWTALLGQAVFNPPQTWVLEVLHAVYPIVGFIVLGEGIVRFALLMTSRRRGEREWMKVMASTYRDHVVLCGLGHVGSRVLESLRAAGAEVVAIERDAASRFAAAARAAGTPVLASDMRDDAVLIEAGVPSARCIVVATDDDLANLEVALDARRMNPRIRVLLRFYDQRMAAKIQAAFGIEEAFSSAALAAPVIAAKALAAAVPAATG